MRAIKITEFAMRYPLDRGRAARSEKPPQAASRPVFAGRCLNYRADWRTGRTAAQLERDGSSANVPTRETGTCLLPICKGAFAEMRTGLGRLVQLPLRSTRRARS